MKPDHADARYYLGVFLMEEREYAEALRHLRQIRQVSSERASDLFRALAYLNYQLGYLAEAQKAAQRARQTAKTEQQIAWAEQLVEDLSRAREKPQSLAPARREVVESPEAKETPRLARKTEETPVSPPKPVGAKPQPHSIVGTLQHLDCLARAARLRILSEGKPLAFAILDPGKVVVKGTNQGSFEFACGAQNPRPVRLDYLPQQDAKLGTVGVIVAMEFP